MSSDHPVAFPGRARADPQAEGGPDGAGHLIDDAIESRQ